LPFCEQVFISVFTPLILFRHFSIRPVLPYPISPRALGVTGVLALDSRISRPFEIDIGRETFLLSTAALPAAQVDCAPLIQSSEVVFPRLQRLSIRVLFSFPRQLSEWSEADGSRSHSLPGQILLCRCNDLLPSGLPPLPPDPPRCSTALPRSSTRRRRAGFFQYLEHCRCSLRCSLPAQVEIFVSSNFL